MTATLGDEDTWWKTGLVLGGGYLAGNYYYTSIAGGGLFFSNYDKLEEHYTKHVIEKMEFGKKITQIEYVNKANKLLSSKVGGNIQGFTNKLGYTFRYNKKLN